MSLPATEYWFSVSARRNRKSFMLANLCLFLFMALVVLALYFFEVRVRTGNLIYMVFYVPFVVVQYFLTAQRLRDFGVTGWLALTWVPLAFLPQPFLAVATSVFFLVLCSVPGTQGSNRYGNDPLDEYRA